MNVKGCGVFATSFGREEKRKVARVSCITFQVIRDRFPGLCVTDFRAVVARVCPPGVGLWQQAASQRQFLQSALKKKVSRGGRVAPQATSSATPPAGATPSSHHTNCKKWWRPQHSMVGAAEAILKADRWGGGGAVPQLI